MDKQINNCNKIFHFFQNYLININLLLINNNNNNNFNVNNYNLIIKKQIKEILLLMINKLLLINNNNNLQLFEIFLLKLLKNETILQTNEQTDIQTDNRTDRQTDNKMSLKIELIEILKHSFYELFLINNNINNNLLKYQISGDFLYQIMT